MVLLFDAANTLIHKPKVATNFIKVLENYGIFVDLLHFNSIHKIVSESFAFPDRTSENFYNEFNKEVLYGLGVIPNLKILKGLYSACSYLPWEKFEDTEYLSSISCRKAVLSNFHTGLHDIIKELFPNQFSDLVVSEDEDIRKPEKRFFEIAIHKLNVEPADIIYIGDSIKLDLEPALNLGINAWLIDRNNYYPYCTRRISSLRELSENLIKESTL